MSLESLDVNNEEMAFTFNSIAELLNGIKLLDEATEVYKVPAKNLHFFHVAMPYKEKGNTSVYITKYEIAENSGTPIKATTAYTSTKKFAERFGLGEDASDIIERDGNTVVSFDDGAGNTRALIMSDKVALNSLCNRCNIGGSAMQKPSIGRNAFIQELILRQNKDVNIIARGARLYGILSDDYSYVPQLPFFTGVFECLENDLKDNMQIVNCVMTHEISSIRVTFGKLGEDIKACYPQLKDMFTPGMLVMTSDTGASSMKVFSLWKLAHGGSFLLADRVTRRHVGSGLFDFEKAKERIFAGFEDVPKKLVEHMAIDIPSYVSVSDLINTVAERIGIAEAIGKRMTKKIVTELSDELPTTGQTAYDISYSFLSMPKRIENENIRFKLELIVSRVLRLDYEKMFKHIRPLILTP